MNTALTALSFSSGKRGRFPSFAGFSLVELITTMSIAAILLTMAVPSFSTMTKDNRQITQANDMITTLMFARSEAIKRGTRITVCKSGDGASCAASGGWQQGWIAFVDVNADATVNAGEEVLRVHGALNAGTTFNGDSNLNSYISYTAQGGTRLTSAAVQSGVMVECDDRGFGPKAQAITLSATGRATSWAATDAGAASCTP